VPDSRKAVEATLAFLCHVHLASTCPPATTHRPHPHPLPNERQHSNACQFLAFPLAETLSQVRLTYALLHTRYQGSKSPCFAFCLPTMHGGKEIPSKIAANGNFFKKISVKFSTTTNIIKKRRLHYFQIDVLFCTQLL